MLCAVRDGGRPERKFRIAGEENRPDPQANIAGILLFRCHRQPVEKLTMQNYHVVYHGAMT